MFLDTLIICEQGRNLPELNRKHSARWQHLSWLKASDFLSLKKNLALKNATTYTCDW